MSEHSDAGSGGGPPVAAWLVALGLVAMAGLLILMGEPIEPPLSRGDPAPSFSLPDLENGEPVSLADMRGRVALVNFWATWCKPCEDEMPAMENLHQQLKDQGFTLLAVAVDESRDDVDAFRERLGITFPILLDPAQVAARKYQTTGFPESILVDSEGVIVERYVGPREWDHPDYVGRVQKLLQPQN
ncbi:MAG: TlpA disulfide reductase family protein [Myxococcota bacterium]|nr:TlpA disulfide reductase family protein [Myxococcota bacterium]